ncbi:MAG: YbfB/YjiJ family MFS transporter [Rhodobacteraceae bacterium]|nr:YbfB/YjiJ family MFS transporter [Paracoccaceae bacterium]
MQDQNYSGAQALWILAGLAFGVCITSGFARFAYGLILPSMQDDLGWGFAQAGWINTANALGYLLSAVVSVGLFRRFAQERLFAWGVVLTTLTLVASGLTRDFWVLSFWRFASGVFAAPVFIAAGALASNLFGADQRRNAMAIALTFGGGGLGMVLAAVTFPPLFAFQGAGSWPVAWLSMGVASVLMMPLSLWAARQLKTPVRRGTDAPAPRLRSMGFEIAGYFMFAVGYIVYLTFLSAWMRSLGAGPWMVSAVWSIVGVGTLLSSFIWRGVIGRFQSGVPLALTNGCVAVAILLPVVFPTLTGLLVSSALFGLTVFMPPTSVTSFIRQNNPPDTWGRLMSVYTVMFATGQCIGPYAAGLIGDAFDNIGYGLVAAAVILAIGAVCGAMQRGLVTPPAKDAVLP